MVSQKKDKGFTPEGTGTMTRGVYGQRVQQALKWKCSSPSHIQLFGTPKDCSLPDSSIHGILPARILEWVAISLSRDLPDPEIKVGSPTLQAGS